MNTKYKNVYYQSDLCNQTVLSTFSNYTGNKLYSVIVAGSMASGN